ncbi:MAG: HD domain-containing protein [Patescibacteria group bacterium]
MPLANETQPSPATDFSAQVVDIPKLESTLTSLTSFTKERPQIVPGAIDTTAREFIVKAAEEANTFKTNFEKQENILTPSERTRISEWVRKDEGETGMHQLEQLGRACIRLWSSVGRSTGTETEKKMSGLPGHDKRHLLQDLTAGLQFRNDVVSAEAGNKDEYQKIGLIGSLLHDVGRLAEERVVGTPVGGEQGDKHTELSFYIAKQLFDAFPQLDQAVRDHILYSILVHQKWPNKSEEETIGYQMTMNEPLNRSVMGSDRLQLVGPEAILRFIGFDIGESDKPLDFDTKVKPERKEALDNKAETDLSEHIEFYMRNLLPVEVPGSPQAANNAVNQRCNLLRAISGAYLWLSSSDEIRKQIFAPELARDRGETVDEVKLATNKKRILSKEIWGEIKGQIAAIEFPDIQTGIKTEVQQLTSTKSLEEIVMSFVKAENASTTQKGITKIKEKVGKITDPAATERLKVGIGYALAMRDRLSRNTLKTISAMNNDLPHFPAHSLEKSFSQFVLNNYPVTLQQAT